MTIEGRASDYLVNIWDVPCLEDADIKDAYIQGAIDQRKIDVEKACKWLRKNCVGVSWIEDDVEMFRRAMMED